MDLDADSNQLRQISKVLNAMSEEIHDLYCLIQIRKDSLGEAWHDRRYEVFLGGLEELLPSILKAFQYIQDYGVYLEQRANAVDEYLNPSG